MADFFDPKFGQLVALPFYVDNVTTGESNTDLTRPGSGTLYVMPFAGSVVGIGIRTTAAVTAGSLTVKAHKDTTEYANSAIPTATITTTAANESYATCRPGALTFAAGEAVGLSITTTTDMAPTDTNDVNGVLYVVLNPAP